MSYRWKLMILITLLITFAFGVGGTLMIEASFRSSLALEKDAALKSFESVQNTLYLLNSVGEQTNYKSINKVLTRMSEQNMGTWQTLSLKDGEELIFQNGIAMPESLSIPVPPDNQCACFSMRDTHGYGMFVLTTIEVGANRLELSARFDLSSVYELRKTQMKIYNIIFAAVMVLGGISAFLLSLALTRPLRKLARTTRKIAAGDLAKRSRIASSDEFGQLSKDFDAMADKLEENMQKLEADMERQERFMGAFAHELKTPMTSIIGFSDLLRQGNLDENTRIHVANYIYSEGRRLEGLSFKLLDLFLLKQDELHKKTVALQTYLAEIEQIMRPSLENRGIRLLCFASEDKVVIETDLIKSLLYNLIDNAAKAIEKTGWIEVHAMKIDGCCQFQVIDNGRGMEAEELDKITEAFYRVDKARARSQGGAGLGLSLCKQIVELHHGTMEFESTVNKGTKVTVRLYAEEIEDKGC